MTPQKLTNKELYSSRFKDIFGLRIYMPCLHLSFYQAKNVTEVKVLNFNTFVQCLHWLNNSS